MRAFVLTYHSGNLAGNEYASNNLLALADDLEHIHALRVPIVPLRRVVDALLRGAGRSLPPKVVAITLDDGLDFDFVDLVHPFHGPQRSVHSVLRRFAERHATEVHATTFVIASPDARRQIATREMLDHQWINDYWWADAVASGLFHVGSHGWDHMSPSVVAPGESRGKSGTFLTVDNFAEADLQVRAAREYIEATAPNPGTALFAYPYGSASAYLIDEYLPRYGPSNGTIAAVTGEPGPVHDGSDRWRLGRFTFGVAWRAPDELRRILEE
jgi:hypothetical protein